MSGDQRVSPPPRRHGPVGRTGLGGGRGRAVRAAMGGKPRDFRKAFRRLLWYLAPYRARVILIMLLTGLSTLLTVLAPRILGRLTTSLYRSVTQHVPVDGRWFVRTLLLLAVLYVFSFLGSYLQQFIMAGVSNRIVRDMRRQIDRKLGRLPLRYFDSSSVGDVLSCATNDVDNISDTLESSTTQVVSSAVTMAGAVTMMLIISPLLTLLCLVLLPAGALLTRGMIRRSQRYFEQQWQTTGELDGHIEEMFSGHAVVKAFNYERQSVAGFREINRGLYASSWKAQFISGFMLPIMALINNLSYIAICVLGGIGVIRGTMAIGDVQAFVQYANQLSQPVSQLATLVGTIQSGMASAERVFGLLDETEEVPDRPDAIVLRQPRGHVCLDHISFSYDPARPLIRDFTLDVRSGENVAIVGPTGAGKTTIVNLLMRFYDVDAGAIRVDGVDIRDLRRGDLRAIFGMVLQDTWLFDGTIRDNIAYGRAGATEDQIVQAARTARIDHFVRTLPQGYGTVLTADATSISEGQKQLLTIARAVLADPSVLLLDEATSSVDSRTELLVQSAMTALMRGRTCFVIAHRLSTIRDADRILAMDRGAIVEQGTHRELLARGGFYAALYNAQFAGREPAGPA